MQFLEIVGDSRLSITPDGDWYIDIEKFMKTIAGKAILEFIKSGWGIILGNVTPFEKAMTDYVRNRGGNIFTSRPPEIIIAIHVVVIAEGHDPGNRFALSVAPIMGFATTYCWIVKRDSKLLGGHPVLIGRPEFVRVSDGENTIVI